MVGLAKVYGQIYLLPFVKITHTKKLNGNLEFIVGWLKWEIVLNLSQFESKPTYEAFYLPACDGDRPPTKGGFKTRKEAWDYASEYFCEDCKKLYDMGHSCSCDAEWGVDIE